jgi:hypothetical protein
MNFWTRWDKKDPSNTHTSLILKRQIPIRFDEEPRSWLGGLPMMPRGTKWPRDAAGDPLHFIAQVACADIPPALWNGLGPRQGWLLLFLQFHKFEEDTTGGEATKGAVQVLHIKTLGIEHPPPDDLATVRHAMSDDIGRYTPEIRPGVPKLWRKWPVDLVAHVYSATDEELETVGPPAMSAEELYEAPVSDDQITVHGGISIDRPLTWRGALYIVEGALRDLEPEEAKRKFESSGGLLDAPEVDQSEFDEEFYRRSGGKRWLSWCSDQEQAAKDVLAAEIANERRVGWIKRAFVALEKQKREIENVRDKFQGYLDSGVHDKSVSSSEEGYWSYVNTVLQDKKNELIKLEQDHTDLIKIQDSYPGPEGEARLNAEIKSLGEAHVARLPEHRARLEHLLNHILAQDL